MYSTGSLVENGETAGRVLAREGTMRHRHCRYVTQVVLIMNDKCFPISDTMRSSANFQAPPNAVDFLLFCNKVDHKQESIGLKLPIYCYKWSYIVPIK